MARPKPQRMNPSAKIAKSKSKSKSTSNSTSPSKSRPPARSGNPAKAAAAPAVQRGPITWRDWVGGARLRTLPLAIAPVALGTGAGVLSLAFTDEPWHPWRFVLALIVALALQVGVNYANDYSDGIRGTDAHRVGPARLTGSGLVPPKRVLAVALTFFAIAAVAGLVLVVLTQQWWLLAVGAAAIVAAWFYTGGTRPYGYQGLGELFVFVFFGLVATAGSAFVQALTVNLEAWTGGAGVGLIACAVLMANNLRDIDQDREAGKRTLAVIVGPLVSRILFAVFLLLPFGVVVFWSFVYPTAMLVLFALLAAIPAAVIVGWGRTPREFIAALQLASLTGLAYGVGMGLVFAL